MKKRIFSILLSLCMGLTLLPSVAQATDTTKFLGDFSLTYDEGGTEPTFDNISNTLIFTEAGEYTVAMASGKSSTTNRIEVTAADVTLNLNGVVINAPKGTFSEIDGKNALTVTSGTVTLNVIANSSLTGGAGEAGSISSGNGGAGISGNVTVSGTAALTATGGAGAYYVGGAGGSGGAGISGNVVLAGSGILTAKGGNDGVGTPAGLAGVGIKGNVDVSGTAALAAVSGSGAMGIAISNADRSGGGSITVGEGYTVVVGTDAEHTTALTENSSTLQYMAIIPPAEPTLPTAAAYAAGASSPTDYMLDTAHKTLTIYTAKGAAWWSKNSDIYNDDEYTVLLANDIDVSGFKWTPIGTYTKASDAVFDGQGHSITGLTVKIEADNETVFAGLFGQFCGSIKNVGLVNVSIIASNTSADNKVVYVGALAGNAFNANISNCFVRGGSISAASGIASYAGGLVGYLGNGTAISNCYSTANAAAAGANGYGGSVIGYINAEGTMANCYYQDTATVTGTNSNLGTSMTKTQMKTNSGTGAMTTLLNTWVKHQDSIDYYTWKSDSGETNSGYPVFDGKWTEPKAQWGVAAGENNDQPPIDSGGWINGTLTDAVAYANELSSGTAYIKLQENVAITKALVFASGKTTILDLNGKTIDRGLTKTAMDGNVITAAGTLIIKDSSTGDTSNQGHITGGYSSSNHGGGVSVLDVGTVTLLGGNITGNKTTGGWGGGVRISSDSRFIMQGGSISGNIAYYAGGGGVGNEGSFTMTGGSISGNSCVLSDTGLASIGGGVINVGEFNMSGGNITGNSTADGGAGGGVFTLESMTLSGNVNISGNTAGMAKDNVALLGAVKIAGALTNSTAIGISIVELSEDNDFPPKTGIFTVGNVVANSDYISKFVSDHSGFAVIADGSQLKLMTAQAITKTAATNGSFTVKVNGNQIPSAIEGQTVTVTPKANSNYELDTITVCKTGETSTAVTVTNGSFIMPDYAVTVCVTFKEQSAPPSGGKGGTSGGGTSAPAGAPVIVDGKTQNIGTENKASGSTTVTIDQSKLRESIGSAQKGSSVVVAVSENSLATASLVVKNIEDMANKGMTLTVKTGSVAYNLNTSAIDTAALAAAFPDADMSAVPFNVTIANSSVNIEGETLVLSPVEFTVTASFKGQTVTVDTFSAYIDRVIEVTKEQAAKITTAVFVNADGSTRHVPTKVIEQDGKYYAIINSRTNSTYALIQNEVSFTDAKDKWFEAVVNEMGSRKIITGRSTDIFDGEASITRAEFIAILIRALGLSPEGESSFADVPADAWYKGSVAAGVKYGLTDGKGNNKFAPNANITRQEAMLILQRAAALTEFVGTSGYLDSFSDSNALGDWAQAAAKWSVGSGLIQGDGGRLNPTANITRAESAAVILRLLQKAELVDMRSKA